MMVQTYTHPELIAAVLQTLDEASGPIGSSVIHERLLGEGFRLSEPTVGRLLRDLDREGCTTRRGRLGRVLAAKGRDRLRTLRDTSSRERNARLLFDNLRGETYADVLDFLYARRGIEREIARAAARAATPADIEAMREQHRRMSAGADSAGADSVVDGLHGLLAKASHNPLLESVYRLITQDPNHQRRVNRLLESQGKLFDLPFDVRLIDAVARHDSDAAEAELVRHLGDAIATIERLQAATPRKPARID